MWKISVFMIFLCGVFWINSENEPTVDREVFIEHRAKSQWYYVVSRIKGSETLSEKLFYKGMLKEVEEELKKSNVCVKQTYYNTNFERCI